MNAHFLFDIRRNLVKIEREAIYKLWSQRLKSRGVIIYISPGIIETYYISVTSNAMSNFLNIFYILANERCRMNFAIESKSFDWPIK